MNTTRSHGALDARDLAARLPDGWLLDYAAQTGSTNADLLARWSDDAPDGRPIKAQLRALTAALDWTTACAQFAPRIRVADEQTAGRGRQGRPWRTVPGEGLLFSLAIVLPCPVDRLSGLSLAVGLGVVDALRSLPGMTSEKAARVGLKWPNDVLLDDAKLGGILIEMGGIGPHACAVVIGIGLNLRGTPSPGPTTEAAPVGLPPACLAMLLPETASTAQRGGASDATIGGSPTSHLADGIGDDRHDGYDRWRATVLCAIAQSLSTTLSAFSGSGFAAMRDAWWRMHRFAGRAVRILDGGVEKLSGIAAGVDPSGQLLIAPFPTASEHASDPTPPPTHSISTDMDNDDDAVRATWIPVQAGDVSLRLAGNARIRHRLLIDSGNSRRKWALTDASGKWLAHGAADGDVRAVWRTLTPPDTIWISNVAGATLAAEIAADCTALWPDAPQQVIQAQPAQCGVINGYVEPEKLGSDRWAGMIAARAAYPGEALLIATFGTATTIDTITADGDFVGGWIAPGWSVMLKSLGQNTAQLPTLNETNVHAGHATGFARATREAIIEGCRQAQAGMILSAWHTWCATTKDPAAPRRCIVAGGAASDILPALPIAVTRHDDLVLHGLSRIARTAEAS
jgi:type III pantothenate kinase